MKSQIRERRNQVQPSVFNVALGILAIFIPVFLLGNYNALAQEESDSVELHNTHILELSPTPNVNTSFAPKVVTVTHGTDKHQEIVYGETVEDALMEIGFKDFENYTIRPDLESKLTSRLHIVVKDYKKERKIEYEEIPFESKTVIDHTREIDTLTLVQEGRVGKRKLVVEYIYVGGILKEKNIIRKEIVTEAQDRITALGTKRVFREITINGDTFEYWKKLRVYATSYDSNCEGCSNYTATGAYLRKGVIAVDPTVIPLYTNMYVPGYGFGQALDVGGAVKGNHIDLGFEDLREVQGQWSARYVDIYILD